MTETVSTKRITNTIELACEDGEYASRILDAALEALTAEAVDKVLTAFGIEPRLR